MNDTKELKSEYVALGRGSWEGITNSSLLHAARCGLLLQDTGKGPRKQAEPGSVRTLVTSSSWRLSPAFLAFLVASDKSSFQPGGCPLPPKKTRSAQVGKAPSPTTCHTPRLGASRPRRGQGRPAGEVPGSGLSRAAELAAPQTPGRGSGRPRGKATSRQAPRCPHRLGRKNGGGEARRRGGRRSEPGWSPPRARDPRSPPTPRALRVRRRSPEEEPPSRSRRLGRAIRQLCARNASHPATRRGRQKCQAMTGEEG